MKEVKLDREASAMSRFRTGLTILHFLNHQWEEFHMLFFCPNPSVSHVTSRGTSSVDRDFWENCQDPTKKLKQD